MPYLHLQHKRIYYTDTTPKDDEVPKETFIFHHGLGSTHCYYQALIPTLTLPPNNIRCITYDVVGSGLLSDLPQDDQSIQSLADDVIEILATLKVEKAVLVGHSFGGIVTAHLAAKNSDVIIAAVLIGPVLPNPSLGKVFLARAQTVDKEGMEAMGNTVPVQATGSKSTFLQHAFIRTLLMSQRPQGYISLCRVVAFATPPDYESIKIPILIITSDEDKSAPLEGCEEIFRRIGGEEKKITVLEGVGHWHCIEAPDQVATKIMDFYREIQ